MSLAAGHRRQFGPFDKFHAQFTAAAGVAQGLAAVLGYDSAWGGGRPAAHLPAV